MPARGGKLTLVGYCSVQRLFDNARLSHFGVPDLAGFVNLLVGKANGFWSKCRILVRKFGPIPSYRGDLAPLLRGASTWIDFERIPF